MTDGHRFWEIAQALDRGATAWRVMEAGFVIELRVQDGHYVRRHDQLMGRWCAWEPADLSWADLHAINWHLSAPDGLPTFDQATNGLRDPVRAHGWDGATVAGVLWELSARWPAMFREPMDKESI